ncbi:hypothetical protein [Algoriphagus sp. NG3]|uniref:hypothetical protein n=1 Tax=Algoriphagus sp. NG3 TaxID=3097546 RepID=UPI002A811981|nr:hypothetical protein [Algoriphagus sp. NG3]WPR76014.1 hypothetical protein SLW71_01455 [Algoriphagus sp. NG3]
MGDKSWLATSPPALPAILRDRHPGERVIGSAPDGLKSKKVGWLFSKTKGLLQETEKNDMKPAHSLAPSLKMSSGHFLYARPSCTGYFLVENEKVIHISDCVARELLGFGDGRAGL